MKRALMPILWLLAALALLAAGVVFYETKWGDGGPFSDGHEGHGH
jgi:hypothetical protein